MKMNLGSARPIRFLALVLTLTLVMSCVAIPAALGEAGINTTYSILGLDEHYPYLEYMFTSEYADKVDVFDYVNDDSFFQSIPEGSTVVYYVVGENGISLMYNELAAPNMMFFFNACVISENASIEEYAVEWAGWLIEYLAQGTDLYVYLLSDGSRYAESTRSAVDYLFDLYFDAETRESLISLYKLMQLSPETRVDSNPIVDCQLIEISENSYSLNDASGNAFGTLHVIDLDGVTIEYESDYFGPWMYVFEDMLKRLGITEE